MPITNTAYIRDRNKCFGPVMFPGETYAFYINADTPISDPNFDTFRLDLIDDVSGEVVAEGIGVLEKDVISGPFYNILCSFICPTLPFGWYRMAIVDTAELDPAVRVKVVSNTLNIEEFSAVKNTAFISYRNEENLYGYRYEENPTFYNKIRLPLIQTGFRIETDRTQYRNVTNRRLRNLKNYKDMIVRLESYYYDENGHLAISAIYDHDTIFVDNHFIVPKSEYTIEENLRAWLTKGNIEVIVDVTETPPAEAQAATEYLVDNTIDEILANGDFIVITQ